MQWRKRFLPFAPKNFYLKTGTKFQEALTFGVSKKKIIHFRFTHCESMLLFSSTVAFFNYAACNNPRPNWRATPGSQVIPGRKFHFLPQLLKDYNSVRRQIDSIFTRLTFHKHAAQTLQHHPYRHHLKAKQFNISNHTLRNLSTSVEGNTYLCNSKQSWREGTPSRRHHLIS